jgi:low temperature requirement protein LtrA
VFAIVPFLGRVGAFDVQPDHLVERHGLVLIIALGESIISIGVGAAGEPVTLPLVTAATLALALSATLWWSYFARDERFAEHALRNATGSARARLALYALGYAQLIMIGGIVVSAAGVKLVLSHLHEATPVSTSTLLAAGIAMYLLGDLLFRRLIGIPSSAVRATAAALCVATIAIGVWSGGTLQIAALVLLFVAMLSVEHMTEQPM